MPAGAARSSQVAGEPAIVAQLIDGCWMARYLVTGGAGFIGSHLVEALIADGHSVRVLDDLSTGRRSNVPDGVQLMVADIADPEAAEAALEGVEGCFHLAAIASVERCNRDWRRTHQVNLGGTINLFDAAHRSCGDRDIPIVYASSAAVYGNCGAAPVEEEACATPLSAYGADKRACELHARAAGLSRSLCTLGLRFFNVYGPRQDPRSPYSGVIAIFLDRLRRGEPIEIFGDGRQVRDFTYIADAVAALRQGMAAASPAAPVFNVCTGRGTSVRRLAETVADLCRTKLIARYRPARCADVAVSIGDPRLAAEDLGFHARTHLCDGLALTLDALGGLDRVPARAVA